MHDLVTIGMPVRNGARDLPKALDSLLAQTHRNLQIIISDNCSTDDTVEVCERYAARDPRIRVVRQPSNLGIYGNFRFVLNEADSEFFMWACHDDTWAPTFIEKNLLALAEDPAAIGSISRVMMILPDGSRVPARGTAPLRGGMPERLTSFLSRPSEASRFYAVHRTEPLRESFPDDIDVFGYDYVVLALAITRGEYLEVPEFLMERESHDFLYYQRTFVARQPQWLKRWFAAHDLSRKIYERIRLPYGKGFRRALLRLELRQTAQYALFCFPGLQGLGGMLSGRRHSPNG